MALKIPKRGGPESFMGWLFPAFGMLFVLQALYLLVGHYLRNWLEWGNVEYAVTNRRTVIRRGLWQVSEMSRPHSESPIELRAKSGADVGDVIFQARGKFNVNDFRQQLSRMFNPEVKSGEFGLLRSGASRRCLSDHSCPIRYRPQRGWRITPGNVSGSN